MTSMQLLNIYNNTKKASKTDDEILESVTALIKDSFREKVDINKISTIADKHFQGIRRLFLEERNNDDELRKLFLDEKTQDGLKYLFLIKCKEALGISTKGNYTTDPQEYVLNNLAKYLKSLDAKKYDTFYEIFKQYGENINKQDLKSVSVFEAIKLFFANILAKFKTKRLEDFDDEHTIKIDNSKFYCSVSNQEDSKQKAHEPDREIIFSNELKGETQEVASANYMEENLQQKASKSPTLETIFEEDEDQSIEYNNIIDSKIAPQIEKQLVKPLIPLKSQKVLDASERIMECNKKIETPSYTPQLTIDLKPAKKPFVAPKPTVKVCHQTEKQYGKNVANKKKLFESLNSDTSPGLKVKRKVEKFEAKNTKLADPSIGQNTFASKSCD